MRCRSICPTSWLYLFCKFKRSWCQRKISISNSYRPCDVRTVLCPNITGAFDKIAAYNNGSLNAIGCCSFVKRTNQMVGGGTTYLSGTINISAKSANQTYSGNTLQPAAFQILIIIKIWAALGWTVVELPNKEPPLFAFIFKTTWWSLSPTCKFEFNWLVNSVAEKQPV